MVAIHLPHIFENHSGFLKFRKFKLTNIEPILSMMSTIFFYNIKKLNLEFLRLKIIWAVTYSGILVNKESLKIKRFLLCNFRMQQHFKNITIWKIDYFAFTSPTTHSHSSFHIQIKLRQFIVLITCEFFQ